MLTSPNKMTVGLEPCNSPRACSTSFAARLLLKYPHFTGAADKAVDLVGCKSPHHLVVFCMAAVLAREGQGVVLGFQHAVVGPSSWIEGRVTLRTLLAGIRGDGER